MTQIAFTLADQRLQYQFVPTPLADLWLSLAQGGSWPKAHSVSVSLPQQHTELRTRLDSVCDQLALATRDLNQLHLLFHQSSEHTTPLWAELNSIIHQLEHQQRDLDYAWIKFSLPLQFEPHEIADDLRPFWSQLLCAGDLCLGYHTVGKTLWHCFWDDDPEPVRQGLLAPQQQLGPELLLRLGGRARSQRDQWPQLIRWLQANDLEHCVDPRDPQHRYPGQPLLARLTTTLSPDFLAALTMDTEPRDIELEITSD
jgi:hypothetical protein